jgi:hypothetical protein
MQPVSVIVPKVYRPHNQRDTGIWLGVLTYIRNGYSVGPMSRG